MLTGQYFYLVFLSETAADSTDEHTESDKGNDAVENYHAHRPTGLTLQLVVVPVHPIIAQTFSNNSGKVSSEPGPTGTDVQLVVLTEQVPVQPAAVLCSPAQHPVPHPPVIALIKPPPSVSPLQELTSRLGFLGERGDMRDI